MNRLLVEVSPRTYRLLHTHGFYDCFVSCAWPRLGHRNIVPNNISHRVIPRRQEPHRTVGGGNGTEYRLPCKYREIYISYSATDMPNTVLRTCYRGSCLQYRTFILVRPLPSTPLKTSFQAPYFSLISPGAFDGSTRGRNDSDLVKQHGVA